MDNEKLNRTEVKENELKEVAGGSGEREPKFKSGDIVITNQGWKLKIIALSSWLESQKCYSYKTIILQIPNVSGWKVGDTYYAVETRLRLA